MSNTFVLPGYAGFGQSPLRAGNGIAERSVLTGLDRGDAVPAGYAPRRGVDATRLQPVVTRVPPVPAGPRQAHFYHLRIRLRWLVGLRRARERASNRPMPPAQVVPGF